MAIFYKRNKLLNYKRKDYWEASEALAKFGVEMIKEKLDQLDQMKEFKPLISNPAEMRDKWSKIKVDKIKQVLSI